MLKAKCHVWRLVRRPSERSEFDFLALTHTLSLAWKCVSWRSRDWR